MRYQVMGCEVPDDAKAMAHEARAKGEPGPELVVIYKELVDYNPKAQIKAVVGRAPRVRRKRGEEG